MTTELKNKNHHTELRIKRKRICEQLSKWIYKQHECNLNAKVRFRSDKDVQDNMGNRGWGPVSFYLTDDQQEKYDLSVMLFFNGTNEDIYKIHVYRTDDQHQINFVEENFGNNRYTYDPNELDSKFIYNSIEDFKTEMCKSQSKFLPDILSANFVFQHSSDIKK